MWGEAEVLAVLAAEAVEDLLVAAGVAAVGAVVPPEEVAEVLLVDLELEALLEAAVVEDLSVADLLEIQIILADLEHQIF